MKSTIRFIAVCGAVLFALSFFFSKSHLQTIQIETAGQRFKNIKVLNEMPADELGKVMNLMSAGLGVNCSFCHFGDDFPKDGKKEKEISRQMIRMTLDLNKNNFAGRTAQITCNTRHHGRTHPQSAVNLDPPAGERRFAVSRVPNVGEILEKHTRAVGGRENLAKITSRRITASRVEPDCTTEPEEIRLKGGKLLMTTKYPEVVVAEGFDGARAWKRAGDFEVTLKPDEAEQIRRNAQFFSFTDLKTVYPKMEFRSTAIINGSSAYFVEATTPENPREGLYFDALTGFLIRRTASVPTVLGVFEYQVDYSDYRNFGGVKFPATIRYAMPNITWTQKILKVENNPVALDDAHFRLR